MGHVFVPHFGEPCRSFILGNVSWYVDASGAALHVTWRVLEKRASEQNTVLTRQKMHRRHLYVHAQPALHYYHYHCHYSQLRKSHASGLTSIRANTAYAQITLLYDWGFMHFMGQRACETITRNPTKSFWLLSFSGSIASPKKATKNLEAFARYRECSLDAFHPLMQKREGRHEDRTSGRTQWGCSGACPKRRAVQRRPPRTAP